MKTFYTLCVLTGLAGLFAAGMVGYSIGIHQAFGEIRNSIENQR